MKYFTKISFKTKDITIFRVAYLISSITLIHSIYHLYLAYETPIKFRQLQQFYFETSNDSGSFSIKYFFIGALFHYLHLILTELKNNKYEETKY